MKNEAIPENFDENEGGGIQFENELLKLKIRAEFGPSKFYGDELPPDVENFFLRSIIKVEHAFANRKTISLFEKIGSPQIFKEEQLNDAAIEKAQLALEDILKKKGIFVTFPENETYRNKYIFITQKLFHVQVDYLDLSDVMTHFNCADFNEDIEDE